MTELLNVKKLSERISIPVYTIRQLARESKIPSYKIGKAYLFDPEEVINVIKDLTISHEQVKNQSNAIQTSLHLHK
jgi:excisionase family DNA binding protein